MAEIVRELAATLALEIKPDGFTKANTKIEAAKAKAATTGTAVEGLKKKLEAADPKAKTFGDTFEDIKKKFGDFRSAFEGGFKGGFGGLTGSLDKLVGALGSSGYLAAGAAAVAVTAALAGGMYAAAKAVAKIASEAKKSAAAAGISTDSLQAFNYALGTESDETAKAFTGLSRRMYDAKRGSEEVARAFRDVGVKVSDSKGKLKSAEDVFLELADRFQKMPDGAKKSALASKVLGEELGPKFIASLNKGGAGLRDLIKEAQEFGLVLDQETIKRSSEFNRSLKQVDGITQGLANTIGKAALPMVNDAVKAFVEWYRANREVINQRLEAAVFLIGEGFKFWWEQMQPVIVGLQAALAPLGFFMDLAEDITVWARGGQSLLGDAFMYLTTRIQAWQYEAGKYFDGFKQKLFDLIPIDRWLSDLDRFIEALRAKLGPLGYLINTPLDTKRGVDTIKGRAKESAQSGFLGQAWNAVAAPNRWAWDTVASGARKIAGVPAPLAPPDVLASFPPDMVPQTLAMPGGSYAGGQSVGPQVSINNTNHITVQGGPDERQLASMIGAKIEETNQSIARDVQASI